MSRGSFNVTGVSINYIDRNRRQAQEGSNVRDGLNKVQAHVHGFLVANLPPLQLKAVFSIMMLAIKCM